MGGMFFMPGMPGMPGMEGMDGCVVTESTGAGWAPPGASDQDTVLFSQVWIAAKDNVWAVRGRVI